MYKNAFIIKKCGESVKTIKKWSSPDLFSRPGHISRLTGMCLLKVLNVYRAENLRMLDIGGREGQAAMNLVEKSSKPWRNCLRTQWKISEPCKEQKMCYSGGNRMISPFFSTYGTGSNKSITNKCNFDLFHSPSICLYATTHNVFSISMIFFMKIQKHFLM